MTNAKHRTGNPNMLHTDPNAAQCACNRHVRDWIRAELASVLPGSKFTDEQVDALIGIFDAQRSEVALR